MARRPKPPRTWTEAELQTLETWLHDGRSVVELAKHLNRTVSAVTVKRMHLMRRLYPWTSEQVAVLQRMTEEGELTADIAEVLKRTPQGVRAKQVQLDLIQRPAPRSRHQWSDGNIDDLLLLYKEELSDEQIARKLSFKVTVPGVTLKRRQLGLTYAQKARGKGWTAAQKTMLRELLKLDWSDKEIGRHMERSTRNICDQRAMLGLRRSPNSLPWTASDEEKLREMFWSKRTTQEMIEELSVARIARSVMSKLSSLRLIRKEKPIPYTKEDENMIYELSKTGCTTEQIREKLGNTRILKTLEMKIYILKNLADHDTSRTPVEWTREDSEVVRDAAERGLSNK